MWVCRCRGGVSVGDINGGRGEVGLGMSNCGPRDDFSVIIGCSQVNRPAGDFVVLCGLF